MTRRSETVFGYVVLTLLAAAAAFPIVGIVFVALQPSDAPVAGFPSLSSLEFDNFSRAWEVGRFGTYLRSSAIVAVSVVAISTVLSVLAGYAFGTARFPGRTLLFYLLLVGLIMPFEAVIVPLYYDLRGIGLTDTYWGLILPDIGLSVAFGSFWMRSFFLAAPRSLIEAAKIDGASSLTILWRVLLPQARPAILTMMVLLFMWTWNDFLFPLVMLQSEELRTAPLGIAFFLGQYTTDTQGLAAAAVLVAAPVVAFYIVLHRHFVRGIAMGAGRT